MALSCDSGGGAAVWRLHATGGEARCLISGRTSLPN